MIKFPLFFGNPKSLDFYSCFKLEKALITKEFSLIIDKNVSYIFSIRIFA